jgi:hypothetical protein
VKRVDEGEEWIEEQAATGWRSFTAGRSPSPGLNLYMLHSAIEWVPVLPFARIQ